MSTFSSAMMALGGPLAKKVLTSLGIGVITYVGLDTAVNAALSAAKANFSGMTSSMVQIAAMYGFFTALSIIAGGIVGGMTMVMLQRFGRVA